MENLNLPFRPGELLPIETQAETSLLGRTIYDDAVKNGRQRQRLFDFYGTDLVIGPFCPDEFAALRPEPPSRIASAHTVCTNFPVP